MDTLSYAQGDTAPELTGNLSLDVTGASIVCHVKRPDRTVLTKTATITDAPAGAVLVDWDADDLAQNGTHFYEWQVTFSNAEIQTVRHDQYGKLLKFPVAREIA